jgi:hypothetical protein
MPRTSKLKHRIDVVVFGGVFDTPLVDFLGLSNATISRIVSATATLDGSNKGYALYCNDNESQIV